MSSINEAVLPGDTIPPNALPSARNPNKPLTLGPGLQHTPPNRITTTTAGALITDSKKNAIWIDYNSGRYIPQPGDLVIATVQSSVAEAFNCLLTPHTSPATLPQLAFEGATRKTRPILAPNSLVYARVASCSKDMPTELTCVDPATGKSSGMGPLKGGMVFKITQGMARRLLSGKRGGIIVLEELGDKLGFELAIGRNGMLWVDAGSVRGTLTIGKALQEADENCLGEQEQRKLVEKAMKSL